MPDGDSPFLAVPASEWLAANDSAFAIADRFPVSPGHALVVPRRVIATWWEATDEERADMLALVDEVKRRLDAEPRPTATTSASTPVRRRGRRSCTCISTSSRGTAATSPTHAAACGTSSPARATTCSLRRNRTH